MSTKMLGKDKDGVRDGNVPGKILPTVVAKTHTATLVFARISNLMLNFLVQLMMTVNLFLTKLTIMLINLLCNVTLIRTNAFINLLLEKLVMKIIKARPSLMNVRNGMTVLMMLGVIMETAMILIQ